MCREARWSGLGVSVSRCAESAAAITRGPRRTSRQYDVSQEVLRRVSNIDHIRRTSCVGSLYGTVCCIYDVRDVV